ncbi:MAG: hypothetical protein A2Y77_11205 [Planctomycetes bacterium RBG_13_62_9]|nr:MAG: hypothetical protein A2Y77_11205 [Planctomycetes bacterium RBG_13_62_9]
MIGTPDVSTLALGQLVLRENFDDNTQARIWRTYAESPDSSWVTEVNNRLELSTKAQTTEAFAGYVSNGWRLNPAADFSLRIDLHYDPVTEERGRISLALTPDVVDPRGQYVSYGIGCVGFYTNFMYAQKDKDGEVLETKYASRFTSDATIYISYDSYLDEIYLSNKGYGFQNAWMRVPGVLKGRWAGTPLSVVVGGSAYRLSVASGQAFADNLLVESGTLVEALPSKVYRFWSPTNERHFYTISEEEKEKLLTIYSRVWTYEGAAFRAFQDGSDPDSVPVFRFWSDRTSGHFYTLDSRERDKLIKEYPHVWTYEGVAFYAYPEGKQPTWARPVYRFWAPSKSTHFYTVDEVEKDNLLAKYGHVWIFEGIAWYAVE